MRYFNLDPSVRDKKNLLELLKWKLTTTPARWPKKVENDFTPEIRMEVEEGEVFVTFVNHSTVLIQLPGINILTDPVFSEVAGPFSLLGPRRVRSTGIALEKLPKIDVILISHNHYDHMDIPTLRKLEQRDHPVFIVPLRNRQFLARLENIIELDWWEHHIFADVSIGLTPAQHWSRRGLLDHCKSLWGGFMILARHHKIFFAGDTGYSSHFKMIREKYGAVDLSLLPIGAYEPRWFLREFHMDPEEAVQAHLDLDSTLSLGIHHGTFCLTDEGINDPILHLNRNLASRNIPETSFIALKNGQTIRI